MRRGSSRGWIAGAMVAGVLSAGSAAAATYSVHESFRHDDSVAWTVVPGQAVDSTSRTRAGTVTLDGFDRTLGTLTSATIMIKYDQRVKASASGESIDPSLPVGAWAEADVAFSAAFDGITIDSALVSAGTGCDPVADGPCYGEGWNATWEMESLRFDGTGLSSFLADKVTLDILSRVGVAVSCGNDNCRWAWGEVESFIPGDVWVSYDYAEFAPVPVPPALPLIGASIGALALMRRRRRHGRS